MTTDGGIPTNFKAEVLSELHWLLAEHAGPQFADTFGPVVDVLLNYASTHGQDEIMGLIKTLGSEQSYKAWNEIVKAADPFTRLELLDSANRAAIDAAVADLKRKDDQWKIVQAVFEALFTFFGLLF